MNRHAYIYSALQIRVGFQYILFKFYLEQGAVHSIGAVFRVHVSLSVPNNLNEIYLFLTLRDTGDSFKRVEILRSQPRQKRTPHITF